MDTRFEFFVVHPKDASTRYYFKSHQVREANELAQQLADEFELIVARYDLNGGQSYSYPKAIYGQHAEVSK